MKAGIITIISLIFIFTAGCNGQPPLTPTSIPAPITSPLPTSNNIPPTVIEFAPNASERKVPIDSDVIITFSEPIKAESISASSISILPLHEDVEVLGKFQVDGKYVIFSPNDPFFYDTIYGIYISTEVQDLSSASLAKERVSMFQTIRYGDRIFEIKDPEGLSWTGNTNGSSVSGFAVTDINRDGYDDIIYHGATITHNPFQDFNIKNPPVVLLSQGNGEFINGSQYLFGEEIPVMQDIIDILVEDFNGDGLDDYLFVNLGIDSAPYLGGRNFLYVSQKDGPLIRDDKFLNYSVSDFTHSSDAGDIDNDGDIDVILVNLRTPSSSANITVLENLGDRFLPRRVPNNTGAWHSRAVLVDLDNDGFLDLALGGSEGDQSFSTVIWNNGEGHFNSPHRAEQLPDYIKPGRTTIFWEIGGIFPIDLNNDGYLDLLISADSRGNNGLQALINDGKRVFSDQTAQYFPDQGAFGNFHTEVKLIDIDLDGDLDLIFFDGDPWEHLYYNILWINNGQNVFTAESGKNNSLWRGTNIAIDVDADGDIDIMKLLFTDQGASDQIQRWQVLVNNTINSE